MANKIASALDGEKKLPLRLCYEMGFSKEIIKECENLLIRRNSTEASYRQ